MSAPTTPPPAPHSPPATTTRNLAYDFLRLVCIAGVVAIHTFGAIAADPADHDFATWLGAAALSVGFIWVVPVFVMLSGALTLTPRVHAQGPGPYLKRRALRILPALFFWTFVYLVPVRMLLLGERLSIGEVARTLVEGTAYPHLYFLYLIAGLSFAAPVLAAFLHAGGPRRALVFALVVFGFTIVLFTIPGVLSLGEPYPPIVLGTLTFWLGYLGYYLLGYALSVVTLPRLGVWLAGCIFVVCWVFVLVRSYSAHGLPLLDALVVPGEAALAVSAFVLGTRLFSHLRLGPRATKVVIVLSDAAFGVFLVHLLVLLVPYSLLPGFADHTSLGQTALAYVVILIGSFAIVVGARRIPGVRVLFSSSQNRATTIGCPSFDPSPRPGVPVTSPSAYVHETADVAPNAQIGTGSKVWHYAQVRESASLGDNCIIGRGAYVGTGVQMGDNCKVQNYALVYEPAKLANGVFIGPAVVLTNDHFPRAINADGSIKSAHDWEPVGVTIGEGASIGASATCVAPVTIGRWSLVGAGSVVIKDVPDFALVVGSPARRVGWVGKVGVPLVADGDGVWRCPESGDTYIESDGELKEATS